MTDQRADCRATKIGGRRLGIPTWQPLQRTLSHEKQASSMKAILLYSFLPSFWFVMNPKKPLPTFEGRDYHTEVHHI
ncbi:unnamed protein product [Protopolystoma xenopodis]|uniref:Uncharacterized protein n=1 Tax=Protopolystoma xenopodis TaxID=117903 RepID=A0A3S5ALL5_9PLAT|nr:unnamed protein product [Protopolystoma xenopodis]